MSENRDDRISWSKGSALAWILTRDEQFAIEASNYTELKLALVLAHRASEGKPANTEYGHDIEKAETALACKVGDGSIRKVGDEYSVEDLVKNFPRHNGTHSWDQSGEAAFLKRIEEHEAQHPRPFQLTFEGPWWADYVAVDWLYWGDELHAKLASRFERTSFPAEFAVQDATRKYWEKLRASINDGSVLARAVPFNRISGSEIREPERDISPTADDLSSLQYQNDGVLGPCLVSSSSESGDLHGFCDINIRREDWAPDLLSKKEWGPQLDNKRGMGTLTSDLVGPPLNPSACAHMSLSDAAYLIATEGGKLIIKVRDEQVWQGPFEEVLRWIAAGETRLIGRHEGKDFSSPIEPHTLANVALCYPYQEPEDRLFEQPYIDCDGPLGGGLKGDQLLAAVGRIEYTHLQLVGSDVARRWERWLAENGTPVEFVPSLPVANSNASFAEKWALVVDVKSVPSLSPPTVTSSSNNEAPTFQPPVDIAKSASVVGAKEDTEKLLQVTGAKKCWKKKPGKVLTQAEQAVVGALNKLWPEGHLDYSKAKARDQRINEYLGPGNMVSSRTIQRTNRKVHFR